ncbi:MAG: hypothetical protein JO148_08665 [Acidimicrobiia bacterium]|nr:hypothetical protein [Acidimicrobiia bacterium]
MQRVFVRASIVCLIVGGFGVAAVPAAQAAVSCTGVATFPNNRTGNDLTVPGGATCTLSNVVVGGTVTVQPGGNLVMQGATIGGNLIGNSPASIRIDALPSSCAGSACTQPSIIRGDATITGTSSVPTGFGQNYICNGSRVGGDLSIIGSTAAAPWALGSICSFGGATFGNNLTIRNNAARVDLVNSRVVNDLTVQGNTGGGSIVNNTLGGFVSCGSNNPVFTASGNKGFGAPALVGGTC